MQSDVVLAQTLTKVCTGTYISYHPGDAPPLPWFAYSRQRGEESFADNENYARIPRYRVELLFEENDPELIERFEAALSELGTWTLYLSDYLESEGCFLHDYRLAINPSKIRKEG